jgi:primosomal protein N' (replication factor Y)
MNSPVMARVALPLPIAEPYRYIVPTALADRALPGARVVVPVRQQEMIGIVWQVGAPDDASGLREILAAPDPVPAVTPELLRLVHEASRHWGTPVGMMLKAMLPGALWGRSAVEIRLVDEYPPAIGGTAGQLLDWLHGRGGRGTVTAASRALRRPAWPVIDRLQRIGAITVETIAPDTGAAAARTRVVELVGDPLPLAERERRFGKSKAQGRVYAALEGAGWRLGRKALLERAGASDSALRALVNDGLVRIADAELLRDPFCDVPVTPPPDSLTDAQQDALAELAAVPAGEEALLLGVTGSGKTAVYLERIRQVLGSGRGAILLVPEIALTPQTVARVRGAFGDQVAVLHSGLSDGERADAWRSLRRGDRTVAVGARSAVFAPIENLGLIVLDEEHESSYKNGESPRYHARDVARMRARIAGATLVLGSATPSLETWQRARKGGTTIRLPERIGSHPLPPVELIDLRTTPLLAGPDLPWTAPMEEAVTATLARGEQVLLLLNRRGWSSFLQCIECGAVIECPHCSISMTVHRGPDHLRCHYCGQREELRDSCPTCGGSTSRHRGAGTQQLEQLIAERFPEARQARMDLDTTAGRWSHHLILGRVARGEVEILLGTQMIAKGIDIPRVTLVGVIDADLALHLPDFRAAERTFQLVAQVAGRAGRGPRGGKVLVQTRQGEHYALQAAALHDTEGFLQRELGERSSPPYPPHTALARVVASGPDQEEVIRRAQALADWSERAIAKAGRNLHVLGPAPCPVARIRGEWRWHVLIKGDAEDLGAWVRTVGPRLSSRRGEVRLSVDRDPVSLL